MRKLSLALALIAVSGAANAVTVDLIAHNQRSSSGTLSTLTFDGADGNTASNAVWDWDGSTMNSTGLFWSTSHIGSNPAGTSVIGDKVVDLSLDTGAMTTSATSYECVEGNFLALVGANGCANTETGTNFVNDTTVQYNVGGVASHVLRTLGGDDVSTGNPRGLTTIAANLPSWDATDGAFDLWTIVQDDGVPGGTLIISNGVDLADAGTNYLTFQYAVPVPAAAWLFGSALGLLGWVRRRVA